MQTLLQQFSAEMAALSSQSLRSLVQVRRGGRGIGSGGVWRSDGWIVTNAHVVTDWGGRGNRQDRIADDLKIGLADGRELPGHVIAVDAENDLAAVQIDAQNLPAFVLGDSQTLQPGEMVWSLGFPWGIHGGATIGTVIGVGSRVGDLDSGGRPLLAASLHLRPGHSGGPMVDAQGRLVGINSMMNGPDVGIAVPVSVARRFFDEVEQKLRAAQSGKIAYV